MTSVLVVGGGIAGLVAARSAALAGADVVLLEGAERLGGAVAGIELAGVPVDTGAESLAARGGTALALLSALGLTPVPPAPSGAWLQNARGAYPLPAAGVLGIPAFPLAADVRAVIGTRAAMRAWADRLLPELTVGRERNLGALVRRRMGARVLEELVAPVVGNVYAVNPDEADVESLVPLLNGELTRTGSLSSAVLALRAAAPAGSAVVGLPGGMVTLVAALERELGRFGVGTRTGSPVTAVERVGEKWRVQTAAEALEADRVIVASDGASARALLAPLLPAAPLAGWPEPHGTTVVSLVLDAPSLDSFPRGSGVLVARGVDSVAARALTHSSAKWPWLAALLPPGRHVVRLSYRTVAGFGSRPIDAGDLALSDAARLLDVRRTELNLVDWAITEWRQESQRALLGVRARIEAVRAAALGLEGLDLTGAWLAGTGLASVIADADRAGRGD
jgi:oxygen-dependent protoporphyrinogen oxidase